MESIDPSEWLSAADCACRAGLTVRALRVYEECGLIAPRRSAGGWRQYGPDDLVKLNMIALLKTAGLSLEQIREVTSRDAGEPTLQQILAVQLGTWKRKLGKSITVDYAWFEKPPPKPVRALVDAAEERWRAFLA